MYSEWYQHISAPFRGSTSAPKVLNALDKGLVAIIAAAYLGTLAWLAIEVLWGVKLLTTESSATPTLAIFLRALLVPALSFVIISALRTSMNKPRPYEEFDIDPLIKKDTVGKSFPSRHLFSAVIISCTFCWLAAIGVVAPMWCVLMFVACMIVAFCRLVGGVHFPRDIVGAVAFALAFALIGFVLF